MSDAKPSRWKRFVWFLERAVGAETSRHGSQVAEDRAWANKAREMGSPRRP